MINETEMELTFFLSSQRLSCFPFGRSGIPASGMTFGTKSRCSFFQTINTMAATLIKIDLDLIAKALGGFVKAIYFGIRHHRTSAELIMFLNLLDQSKNECSTILH